MTLDSGVIAPRAGLARPVSIVQLREAVEAQQSWRGVMRTLGFTTSRTGQVLRSICDELGVDYSHFGPLKDRGIEDAVRGSTTWAEAISRAGFAPEGVAYDLVGDFPRIGLKRIQVKTVTAGAICRLTRKEYFGDGRGGHRRALSAYRLPDLTSDA